MPTALCLSTLLLPGGDHGEVCTEMEPERVQAPTSVQGSQVLLGVVVQLLHARWSGGGEEDVSLLIPRCSVIDTQFALCIQVGDSCGIKPECKVRLLASLTST